MITEFFRFVETVLPVLVNIFHYVKDGIYDEEKEHQLALDLIRAAKDKQAKEEIEG